MRTDELPDNVLRRGYDKLAGLYGPPAKGTPDGWIWGVRTATRGWSEIEFHAAVKGAAARCVHFPRPSQIVDQRPLSGPAKAIDVSGDQDRCDLCHAKFYPAPFHCPDGKVRERDRCNCPPVGLGWDTAGAPVGAQLAPRAAPSRDTGLGAALDRAFRP